MSGCVGTTQDLYSLKILLSAFYISLASYSYIQVRCICRRTASFALTWGLLPGAQQSLPYTVRPKWPAALAAGVARGMQNSRPMLVRHITTAIAHV